MVHNRLRSFGREPAAPAISRQPPADLDTGREMGLERGHHQSDGSDKSLLFAKFNCKQNKAVLEEVLFDSIEKKIALRRRKASGHEFHHSNVGVQSYKFLAVAYLPRSEGETLRFNRHNALFLGQLATVTNCEFPAAPGNAPKNLLGAGSFYASRHFDGVSFQHLNFGFERAMYGPVRGKESRGSL